MFVCLTVRQIAVVQSISGTGALRIGFEFIKQFYPGPKNLYLPQPSWGAHSAVVEASGLTVKRYRYFDPKTIGLDFEGMKEDIENAEEGSIVSHTLNHKR